MGKCYYRLCGHLWPTLEWGKQNRANMVHVFHTQPAEIIYNDMVVVPFTSCYS